MNMETLLTISPLLGLFLAALYVFLKEPRQKRTIPLYPPPRGTKWAIDTNLMPRRIELRLMRRFPFVGEIVQRAEYATLNETLTDREIWDYSRQIVEEYECRRVLKILVTETPPK